MTTDKQIKQACKLLNKVHKGANLRIENGKVLIDGERIAQPGTSVTDVVDVDFLIQWCEFEEVQS